MSVLYGGAVWGYTGMLQFHGHTQNAEGDRRQEDKRDAARFTVIFLLLQLFLDSNLTISSVPHAAAAARTFSQHSDTESDEIKRL